MSCAAKYPNACAPKSLHRDWQLVQRLSPSEAKKNNTASLRWDQIAERDPHGRIAHVRALRFVGGVEIIASKDGNDPVPAWELFGLIGGIYLSDETAHEYLQGSDLRDLITDAFLRNGYRLPRVISGEGVDADAAGESALEDETVLCDLTYEWDFSGRRGEGLIPLASLRARGSQAMKLRFGATIPGAPEGLAVGRYLLPDLETEGFEIHADVVYLDRTIDGGSWAVRRYHKVEKQGAFDHADAAHEYIVLRGEQNGSSTGGLGNNFPHPHAIAAIGSPKVSVGGAAIFAGQTALEWSLRDTAIVLSDRRSAYADGRDELALPNLSTVQALPFRLVIPPTPRRHAPAGQVVFSWGSYSGAEVPVLHRYWLCGTADRDRAIKATVTGNPAASTLQDIDGEIIEGVADPTGPRIHGA